MKIKRLVIENFKSIERIELIEPNPFTVFVGPNGSGKSNIFEGIEYGTMFHRYESNKDIDAMFGGRESFVRNNSQIAGEDILDINFESFSLSEWPLVSNGHSDTGNITNRLQDGFPDTDSFQQFVDNHSRIFPKNYESEKFTRRDNLRLASSASNLPKVLKRLLNDIEKREEIVEWLGLFIPDFSSIEIRSDALAGTDTLLVYEKHSNRPFNTNLISDGTNNILALLTAVYQSDEPQFLCIEEPENGLHPQVLTSLVDFFRQKCKEKGHYIWLNTHSESIVRCLTTDEIVLVNKRNGSTQIRQIKGRNIYDLPTDQAWLTGALGGGLPW